MIRPAERRQSHEIDHTHRSHVHRDNPPALSPFSDHPQRDPSLYRLSGESPAAGYHRNAGDLLPQGYFSFGKAIRAAGTDRGSVRGLRAGLEEEFTDQHSDGNCRIYGADTDCILIKYPAGYCNQANGDYASVTAGEYNSAYGDFSSISGGSNNIVVGLASPGLYEDLGLSELSDMDKIIISYDTTKFSLNDCYFAMTPKLLEDIDVSRLNRVDELNSSLNTLQNGMNKLESGSKELSTGASKIDNGMESLSTGIEQALKGSETITEGLNQVVLGSSKLESLTTLIDSLYSTYNDNNKLIETISSGQAKAQYEQGINDATLKKTELENTLSQVNAGISQLEQGEALGVLTEEQNAQLATLIRERTQLEAGIEQYAQGISKAESELAQLPLNAAKLEGANEAIAKIIMGLLGTTNPSDINETNINNFKSQLTALVGGISSLKDGSKELTTGLDRLNNGSKELANGTSSLKEGSKELANGIIKINNEGIKKLSDYGSKLTNYSHKVKTLIKLSKDYNGFASDNSDNTIFIYKLSK